METPLLSPVCFALLHRCYIPHYLTHRVTGGGGIIIRSFKTSKSDSKIEQKKNKKNKRLKWVENESLHPLGAALPAFVLLLLTAGVTPGVLLAALVLLALLLLTVVACALAAVLLLLLTLFATTVVPAGGGGCCGLDTTVAAFLW